MSIERIATKGAARSLVWDGDDLVDVVGGWRRWAANGTESPARLSWAYPFDQVAVSPPGRFHVLYAERGTKALLLDGGACDECLSQTEEERTAGSWTMAR